jgi:DNA/RNA endonuclease YhcR with UshA esterase domain
LIRIRDTTGAISIAVSDDLVALSGISLTHPLSISAGESVEVAAAVSLYKETVQLVPSVVTDIVALGQTVPVAADRWIGELSAGDAGAWATIQGTVTRLDPFSAGIKMTVDDTTGDVIVLLWQPVVEALANQAVLDVGADVRVQGEVSLYRGTLELIPELAEDVQVVLAVAPLATVAPDPTATAVTDPTATAPPQPTPTPPPADTATPVPTDTPRPTVTPVPERTLEPPVDLTFIGMITADRIGQEVTVEGRVIETASFSAGFKFVLDDGTGQITLLLWHNVYDECWDARDINLGVTVRAKGEVGQYEGELQIEPSFGGDVKAVDSAMAEAPRREIGSISSADEGQRMTVEGSVVRVEGLNSAVKVFASDASGEILIFIWRNVLDRIADNTGLGIVGSRVRVTGPVVVYRGTLEVVPALPHDVVVLEMGE